MPQPMQRRGFLRTALGATGALVALGLDAVGQDAGPQELHTYPLGPQVWIRAAGKPFACYRAHPSQKYPYIYPVAGPLTGAPLTTESSDPYPHHRSMGFACDRVNEGNYWQQGYNRGQIFSRGPAVEEAKGQRVVITDIADWRMPSGETDFTDSRRITVSAPSPNLRLIEADITWTASRDVTILPNNHSLFFLRATEAITPKGGGTLVNSEGQETEKDTFGQKAAWCAFYGERHGVTEGIALMDHPENPWSPCQWFTRDYGFISPTPMQWVPAEGMKIAAGETRRMRYLVVAYGGTPDEAGLPAIYEEWV